LLIINDAIAGDPLRVPSKIVRIYAGNTVKFLSILPESYRGGSDCDIID
jgi:hypothetical protein